MVAALRQEWQQLAPGGLGALADPSMQEALWLAASPAHRPASLPHPLPASLLQRCHALRAAVAQHPLQRVHDPAVEFWAWTAMRLSDMGLPLQVAPPAAVMPFDLDAAMEAVRQQVPSQGAEQVLPRLRQEWLELDPAGSGRLDRPEVAQWVWRSADTTRNTVNNMPAELPRGLGDRLEAFVDRLGDGEGLVHFSTWAKDRAASLQALAWAASRPEGASREAASVDLQDAALPDGIYDPNGLPSGVLALGLQVDTGHDGDTLSMFSPQPFTPPAGLRYVRSLPSPSPEQAADRGDDHHSDHPSDRDACREISKGVTVGMEPPFDAGGGGGSGGGKRVRFELAAVLDPDKTSLSSPMADRILR